MSKGILLAGEPMGLFIAQNKGPLEDVTGYSLSLIHISEPTRP